MFPTPRERFHVNREGEKDWRQWVTNWLVFRSIAIKLWDMYLPMSWENDGFWTQHNQQGRVSNIDWGKYPTMVFHGNTFLDKSHNYKLVNDNSHTLSWRHTLVYGYRGAILIANPIEDGNFMGLVFVSSQFQWKLILKLDLNYCERSYLNSLRYREQMHTNYHFIWI